MSSENPFSQENIYARGIQLVDTTPALAGSSEALKEALEKGYGRIATPLRGYSPSVQQHFLVQLLEGAPQAEDIADLLSQINDPKFRWFDPKKTPSPASLQIHVNSHLASLNRSPQPVKIMARLDQIGKPEPEDWVLAIAKNTDLAPLVQGAVSFADNFTQEAIKAAIEETVWQEIGLYQVHSQRLAGKTVGLATGWMVMGDLVIAAGYTRGNPYLPLLEIYKKGYWPMDSVGGKFRVFVPEISHFHLPKTSRSNSH